MLHRACVESVESIVSPQCLVAKAALRRVAATMMIRGVTRPMSTLHTTVRPGVGTQASKNDQTDQRSLHVA